MDVSTRPGEHTSDRFAPATVCASVNGDATSIVRNTKLYSRDRQKEANQEVSPAHAENNENLYRSSAFPLATDAQETENGRLSFHPVALYGASFVRDHWYNLY